MEMNNPQNCIIFEENQANFALLERMVLSFHLNPVKFERLETAVKFLENHPADLVIIDTDFIKKVAPGEITSRVKKANPQCVVVWIYAQDLGKAESEEVKPDIILEKPFGIMLFQQVLTPYIFSQSVPGYESLSN